ncbi:related to DFFRY protein [Rhynchosporium graminicola]|uniref:Related to DFFRY protein n=1 Tax=Rhynchosporium graminicola TaxID=2792576 RepID=A0A1E1KQF5_9HELO|nr:related to DFFRY protein [Rhynchosporium commune]
MEESPRECAITSEPGSGRPNPFNDVAEQTSRKRQRVSRGSLSRSRSVDTAQDQYQDIDSALSDSSMSLHGNSNKAEPECQTDLPSTPPNNLSDPPPAEPTSSRVTINLRTNRTLVSIPSSPVSAASPSKMPYGGGDDTRISVESESDALSTIPPIETPSSTPSAVSSPQIELVDVGDDDSDFGCQDPPLAIIDDEYLDPMQNFPYLGPEDDGVLTAFRRITNFLQYEDITNPECFFKMRDWVDAYLFATQKPDIFQDLYSRHRELWKHFPDIIWSLSHRSKFFGGFLKTSTESRQALTDFFVFFARLAGRFVAMDVRTLFRESNSRNSEPDLASQPFVHALAHLILDEESSGHIGKNLHTYYSWSWGDDSQAMGEAFQEEGGDVFNMTKLTRGKLALMSGNPKMIKSFSDHSRIVSKIVSEVERVLNGRSMHTKLDTEEAYQKLRNAYEFFVVMSDGLDCIIEKHLTYLTGDSATMHMNTLRGILRIAIEYDIEQVRAFVNAQRNEHRDMCQKNLPDAISLGWKFGILKRLITSSQMQLRVVGVTTMCNELLGLHSRYKDSDPSRQPILLLFSAFILENQLVDYLVGIGSHPEIISESGNIIGFLVVTKTYTHQQTDMIWQTVSTSQDPRVVEAILAMLKRCLNLYDYSSLLYLCEKAMGIPIDLFNVPMREFCSHLFKELGSKFQDHSRSLDQQPYDLCVRLIRESSVSSAACPLGYPGIQSFASNKFHDLLRFGPTSEARTDIHQSCITDIAARTSTVPGSICVISILLQEHLGSDLKKLTVEHGLTNLLIEELESVVQAERDTGDILASSSAASSARLELIQMIIVNEPEAITPELGTRLWDVLVGSRSNASSQRNISWQVLNNTAKNHPLNAFIKSCFRDHLQTLPPHCYTTGSLDFVREAITAWFNDVYDFFVDRNRTFDSPALDQLWRMILTAPPDTIDALAINILVETYVSSALIMKIPRQMARSVHSTLVNRCLEQLKGAAAKLKTFNGEPSTDSDDSMIIVASEDQFQEQEMIFARSLAVLREFLRAYQTKPQFAPPKTRSSIITAPLQMDGEPLAIKYQAFDGNDQTEVTKLNLGTLNTVASLFARLENATGFKNYRVYCGGAILDPEEMDISQKLQDLQCLKALLLVHRKEDSPGLPGRLSSDKTTLEFEITKHCKDLWGYLGMHEKVAQEIYYFLIKFPVYDRMLEDFASDVTYTEIFPAGKPFKSLYAGTNRDAALTRAISLIVAAISDPTIVDQCDSDDLKEGLALHMIDCLLQYLKEPVLPISAAPYLDTALFKRLLSFLYAATPVRVSQSSQYLTARSFESMLEASIHNISFWEHFLAHMQGSTLLEDLVLKHPQQFIRKNATKQILTKSAGVPSLGQVSATMFVATFWPMVAHLIPLAVHLPYQCEETFSLGLALFKRFADVAISQLNLEALAQQWGNLLLNHKSLESVGHTDNVDAVAQGLTFMIFYATSFTKASQKTLSCSILGAQLFREHLFPELSIDEEDEELVAKVPLLNPTTRRTLAETVYFLVKDDEVQYRALLLELSRLVPHVDTDDGPYIYDLTWQFDRSKSIRSSAGFVGLKNLSNTCYLNSLFSQLFMNIPFRKFMLDAHVADGGSSQRLLSETQNLFSYMQNSFRRFVDPVNLASSIRTYEETPIDVSIQMDVDEFYNLLFDRWESQILAPDAKREFRSFYGGQLVQQVKSKECPHISERLEPFSAIQCDIKGKSTLEESLQAYVNGEVMEGDNKYKCSTCDRHVDAVKRACLKDIPDNLIFHLKRFDFNLRTLMRSKINDHFQFPKKIDMRPYKVEHLNNEPDTQEDVFELVGVLVHSGTAESGHYYSFIRERPSTGDNESWVEFNDECVSSWDPNRMEGACYGGPDFHGPTDHNNNPYDKSWSAYMLFYQRSTVVIDQKQILDLSGLISPVRLPVPPRLSNYIAMENELLMRKYCLYDPSHAAFVLKMLSNMKNINGGTCSSSHTLEKLALTASLHHLDQVFARTKDTPDFPNIMISIKQICQSCAECSRDYLEWFCDFPETLKQLLIKNPDGLIRHEIATSILAALVKVKADASYAYGFSDEDDSIDDVEAGDPQLIQRVVKGLSRLWDIFHSSFRAWPEYFGLLVSISQMGKLEAAVLLDAGYLQRTMEMISADPVLPLGHQYSRMLTLLSKRLANRPVSFDAVITLLYNLMITCDPSANPAEEGESRLEHALVNDPVPYNDSERNLLMQHWTKNDVNILLEKLLLLRQNPDTTQEILIRLLEFPESLDRHIFQTITIGIKRGNSTMTCSPFLRAAAVYCERSKNPKAWSQMITFVSKMTPKFDNGEGGAVLNFFRDVFEVTLVDQDYSAEDFLNFYFGHLAFWAPHLLTDYEASVRNETEEFIRTNLLQDGLEYSTFGTEEEDLEKAKIYIAAARKLGFACLEHCQEYYLRDRQQAVRAVLVQIQDVTLACEKFFDFGEKDDETRKFYDMSIHTWTDLKKCIVEEPDEEVSDWDGSEGEYDDSSEPVGTVNDDDMPL